MVATIWPNQVMFPAAYIAFKDFQRLSQKWWQHNDSHRWWSVCQSVWVWINNTHRIEKYFYNSDSQFYHLYHMCFVYQQQNRRKLYNPDLVDAIYLCTYPLLSTTNRTNINSLFAQICLFILKSLSKKSSHKCKKIPTLWGVRGGPKARTKSQNKNF